VRFRYGLVFLIAAGGCDTHAAGVSECRDIEEARCAAAVSCGYPRAEECRRYYRDHCLHGVAAESVTAVEADGCVAELGQLGTCAAQQGPATLPAACTEPVRVVPRAGSVCDVVLRPERANACTFLAPPSAAQTEAPAPDGGT
jgi:hypothetical protein